MQTKQRRNEILFSKYGPATSDELFECSLPRKKYLT